MEKGIRLLDHQEPLIDIEIISQNNELVVTQRHNNYQARYVELAKPMAGAFIGPIYLVLEYSDSSIDTGNSSNTIATFISWVLGEQLIHRICVYFNLYTKPNSINPLYRNLKTLSNLGSSVGVIFAALATSLTHRKLATSICSVVMGSIIGLFAFIIRKYSWFTSQSETNIDAQIGTEGWSKYAKTALVFGTSMGQLIGGVVSYLSDSNIISSWANITLYGAITSVVSFVAVIVLVPIINRLTRNKNKHTKKGILVTDNRDVFNSNYVRSGMALGAAIGTILGVFLAPVIIPGLSVAVGIAVSASIFAIVCGIGLGFLGQKLSLYFEKYWGVSSNTDNSWSYASRSTSNFFSCIGIALACALCPGAMLMQSVLIGSAISSLVGWFAGLLIIWLARKIEPDEAKVKAVTLPWTQRISSGVNRGTIIGAFVGLTVGFLIGGPLGLIGCSILFGALGGFFCGIYEVVSDPVFYNYLDKIRCWTKTSASSAGSSTCPRIKTLLLVKDPSTLPPDSSSITTMNHFTSNSTCNRYTLFSSSRKTESTVPLIDDYPLLPKVHSFRRCG